MTIALLAVIAVSCALAACGTSDRTRAERQARSWATGIIASNAKSCHVVKPHVVRVDCRPKPGKEWDCGFSASDGATGDISVHLGSSGISGAWLGAAGC